MSANPALQAYKRACQREGLQTLAEVVTALTNGSKEVNLSHRKTALTDMDVCCLAESLTSPHAIRTLDLEGNSFGLEALQAVMDAIAVNPGYIREVRVGKNNLKDQGAVIIGNQLGREGSGLKVLDLSENGITKVGAEALALALESKSCDLVELSFHSNELDAEAALTLAQVCRVSNRLKHLHLGYNAIRDRGAYHFARALPISKSLLTLDLTANRIGREGGEELVKALLNEQCILQRLNLRHNNFDDELLQKFITVVEKNKTLQQLFLGYMNPTFETTGKFLAAVEKNTTLLCVDVFAWRVAEDSQAQVISGILQNNNTLRALISDAPWDAAVSEGNKKRSDAGNFTVYVGGDDRLAAMAASQAPVKNSSNNNGNSSRSVSAQPRNASEPAPTPYSTAPAPTSARANSPRSTQPVYAKTQSQPSSANQRVSASTASHQQGTVDDDLDLLLNELQYVPCDPELRNHLSLIVTQLQLKLELQRSYQQQQINLLVERMKALEALHVPTHVHMSPPPTPQPQQQAQAQPQPQPTAERQSTALSQASNPPPATASAESLARAQAAPAPANNAKSGEAGSSSTQASRRASTTDASSQPAAQTAPAKEENSTRSSNATGPTPAESVSQPAQQQSSRAGAGAGGRQEPRLQPAANPPPPSTPSRSTAGGANDATQGKPQTPRTQEVKERNDRQPTAQKPNGPEPVSEQQSPAPRRTESNAGQGERSPDPRTQNNAGGSTTTGGKSNANPTSTTSAPRDGTSTGSTSSQTPLFVPPTHKDEAVRVSHSPAPTIQARADAPDLQHSHHTSPNATIENQPQAQQKISRPKGNKSGANIA